MTRGMTSRTKSQERTDMVVAGSGFGRAVTDYHLVAEGSVGHQVIVRDRAAKAASGDNHIGSLLAFRPARHAACHNVQFAARHARLLLLRCRRSCSMPVTP